MASSYAISALTAFGTFSTTDLLVGVDVSDFTQAPTGTTKKSTIAQFTTFIYANPAFTGTATGVNSSWSGTLAVTGAATFANNIVMTAASSKIIPGATAFSIRNNADSASNLLIADNGNGTFRGSVSVLGDALKYLSGGTTTLTIGNDDVNGVVTIRTEGANRVSISTSASAFSNAVSMGSGLTITAGGFALTGAGNNASFGANVTVAGTLGVAGLLTASAAVNTTQLQISTAAGRIVPGATSLSLRNNADSVDNLLITDAGAATFRSTITVLGLSTLNKIKGGGAAPTLSVQSGSAGSLSVTGSDMSGQISFQASASGTLILRLTFASAYATAPFVQLTSVNTAAASVTPLPVSPTTAQVDIAFASAVSNGSLYTVNYQVIA